jgi:hypothetical protein
MKNNNKKILSLAKDIQDDINKILLPPDEGFQADSQKVIPLSLVRSTRGYVEKVANQVNGCFEKGWYDACAVMIRRLIETLLIEAFEYKKVDSKIKNSQGDFLPLDDIIDKAISEPSWNLSRTTKKALPRLKKVGDLSAHSRRYNTHLKDLEPIIGDIRVVIQELIYLASLK